MFCICVYGGDCKNHELLFTTQLLQIQRNTETNLLVWNNYFRNEHYLHYMKCMCVWEREGKIVLALLIDKQLFTIQKKDKIKTWFVCQVKMFLVCHITCNSKSVMWRRGRGFCKRTRWQEIVYHSTDTDGNKHKNRVQCVCLGKLFWFWYIIWNNRWYFCVWGGNKIIFIQLAEYTKTQNNNLFDKINYSNFDTLAMCRRG